MTLIISPADGKAYSNIAASMLAEQTCKETLDNKRVLLSAYI